MTDRAKATSIEHAKGSVMEAIGKLTGNVRIEAEGRRQKGEKPPPKGSGASTR